MKISSRFVAKVLAVLSILAVCPLGWSQGMPSPQAYASVSVSPSSTLQVGQSYSISWTSTPTKTTKVQYNCSATGSTYATGGYLATSGSLNGVVPAAWAGKSSTCDFRAFDTNGMPQSSPSVITLTTAASVQAQTISFSALGGKSLGDPAFAVSASATSGLAVAFSSTTSAVCTVSGSTVSLVGTGTCTVAANQAGNGSYSAAPQVTQSFAVGMRQQTIGFGAMGNKTIGDHS